jgi:hypothetical protein
VAGRVTDSRVVINLPEGGQILVRTWPEEEVVTVDWRPLANTKVVWRPINLCGGSFVVETA